jgi:hypothetical protein
MPALVETLPPPMRFARRMATLTSEGDEVAGDPPSPRLGVLTFLFARWARGRSDNSVHQDAAEGGAHDEHRSVRVIYDFAGSRAQEAIDAALAVRPDDDVAISHGR